MAQDPNTEDAPPKGKKGRGAPRDAEAADNSIQASNPARSAGWASCMTGLVLLLLVLGTLLYVKVLNPDAIPPVSTWGPGRIALVCLLLIVIPIVVFRAVTLWLMGVGPQFVDIEFSWRAGIDAMAKQGITLKSAPLFVIIGGGSDRLRKNLMAAAGIDFRINGAPDFPAPLHWYVSKDAIYLYIDNAAWTNMAARQYRIASKSPRGHANPGAQPKSAPAPQRMNATLIPGAEESLGGQSVPDLFATPKLPGDQSLPPSTPRPTPPARRQAYLGTLSPDQVAPPDPGMTALHGAAPAPARRGRPTASAESSQQLRRLEAVCNKLRLHRQPVCPVNGMLVLLPFDLLQAGRTDIEEVERALAGDLATAKRELQVRCPVTALVVAMEQERGFCELIRRIGRDGAARSRFGQRFDIRREPSVEELKRFSSYACGVFEEWVYTLFRDDKVLSHPGNPSLYNLLCKVRRSFQARLSDVLSKGFGYDSRVDSEPLLFSGCYFAATGAEPERQAFVSGVLSKLREEQEELEWTEDALQADSRRGGIALFGWIVAGLLAVMLAVLVVITKLR